MNIWLKRTIAFALLFGGIALGYFLATSNESRPFSLGLDLSGGSHLEYVAKVDEVPQNEIKDRVEALRDVIERRVNLFGVAEPIVQTETVRLGQEAREHRLIVELPGVTDVTEAVAMIGQTPLLEFKVPNPSFDPAAADAELQAIIDAGDDPADAYRALIEDQYITTELTGRYLRRAQLEFSQGLSGGSSGLAGTPYVALQFDRDGAELFEQITSENVGSVVAIFLDGAPISTPVVQQTITGGEAVITGDFTPEEARELVGRLNSGALPVPIELISTQTIGPSLGADAVAAGVQAALWGFVLVGLYLIFWYRLPGLLAVVALAVYAALMLTLFKLIPVTLTAAGIAGFIISLGIAVDANILIFERIKEEIDSGRTMYDAIRIGFQRAWLSIRDANVSSLISAAILFWFGTSLIQGFALTFGLGILISMFSAITVTRYFMYALAGVGETKVGRFLFRSAFRS